MTTPTIGRIVDCGALVIDLTRHKVFKDDVEIYLTPNEYNLLKFLVEHVDHVLDQLSILVNVWGSGYDEKQSHYIRVWIHHLRAKIEDDPKNPIFVQTVRSRGYKLVSK